jgi:hypothetical protein
MGGGKLTLVLYQPVKGPSVRRGTVLSNPALYSEGKKAKAIPLHAMVALGGSSYTCLTSTLDGSEWSALRPGRALPPG